MKKILIVEGNLAEENKNFSEAGIQTHTESLKDSLNYLGEKLILDVVSGTLLIHTKIFILLNNFK